MSNSEILTSTDSASTVDFMSLLGRCLGNFKIVERAIAAFREAGQADLEQLEAAMACEDFDAIVEIAHRFKGAASNVSAVGLSKILFQAETFGRERDASELTRVMEDLRVAWDGFQRVVQALAPTVGRPERGIFENKKGVSEANHACAGC
jgi:HPt (histidine-containing phosphotransfer) domain-containing protein